MSEKFPALSKSFLRRFEGLSVQGFCIAVAEEFVLLSIVTVLSIIFKTYLLWFGLFMGFFVHLLVHILQWLVFKKYIPAIYTSFIALIYCSFSLYYILNNQIFQISEMFFWTFIGVCIVVINLIFAHKLAEVFDKRNKIS
ncbi:MAG: HXXEE domain-containing protein [Bacteroidales bacterium]|nr:HXXEE domain-containing protein [Bacteroidales bacterium]